MKYFCQTKLKKGKKNLENNEAHLVINHKIIEDKEAEKQFNEIRIKLRQIEISKAKISMSNIRPPYAISSVWKNLKYQDLHTEPKDALGE